MATVYEISEYPPWPVIILLAIQQVLGIVDGPLTLSYILWMNLCAPDNYVLRSELLSTALFMSGVATLLQVTVGVRLPIAQASSGSFVAVAVVILTSERWQCPDIPINGTNCSYLDTNDDQLWQPRIMELSGSLSVAACAQILLGCTGSIGFLMRFIGPITIMPTISLISLSLAPIIIRPIQHQWGIAMTVVCLVILFGLVLGTINVPCVGYTKSEGWRKASYPIFRLFPHLIAVGLAWLLCYVLTITDVFPSDPNAMQYQARTDTKLDVISKAKWWFWPYPGRWGCPTFSVSTFLGMMAATIASIVDSLGDYYATAAVCDVPPPPKHAMNRGIAVEGLGALASGLVGAGHATTSYASSVGVLSITGAPSRIIWQVCGIMLVCCGCVGKVGAALSIIPDPIIGGLSVVGLGMVLSVGLSNLKYIDTSSVRNMLILGISLMLGTLVPPWVHQHPEAINTGVEELDQMMRALLGTAMFVGGFLACILDNIIPGTMKERGMVTFGCVSAGESENSEEHEPITKLTYDLPYISCYLRRIQCCSFVPFLPSYVDRPCICRRCCRGEYQTADSRETHADVELNITCPS